MKIIPIGNDYAVANMLRSVKAKSEEKYDTVSPTSVTDNPADKVGKENETDKPEKEDSGKKKARRFKTETKD